LAAAALVSAQSPNEPALPDAAPPSPADAGAPAPGTTLLESQPVAAIPDPTPTPSASPSSPSVAYQQTSASTANEPVVTTGRPVARLSYGEEGNRKAAQLRSMPLERFTFDRALLRDVLRFLAEAAGIPYVSIPENSPQAQQLVTFRMTASPFAALESVARQYSIQMFFEEGVWSLRLPDTKKLRQERLQRILTKESDNELIGVMYQLRHDSLDRVDFRSDLQGQQGSGGGQGGANANAGTGSSATGSSAGVGSVAPQAPTLPLQNSQKVFARSIPRVVNDIRAIVGLPPLVMDKNGNVSEDKTAAGGAIVDADRLRSVAEMAVDQESSQATAEGSASNPSGTMGSAGGGLDQPNSLNPLYIPPERPQVVYNSDLNFIWVVATRKQQKWVAEYLSKVDKPQDLIAIEVKFLETKKNPQVDIGINWQNTFGTGLTIGGQASVGSTNPLGSLSFARQNGTNAGTLIPTFDGSGAFAGYDTVAPGLINNNFTSASGQIPYSAILSLNQFSATLQAFMQDRDTSIVQYPRVLTLNNREVAITSAENTPLNVGTSTAVSATGTSGTTVGQLGYLPTGTQINILPKVIDKNQIAMTVAITVSSVIGEIPINLGTGSNLYPVTSGRVYNASLQVDSGYTLAVGGLEKVDDSNVVGGIPVLKDIPGVGYLFKNKNKRRNKVNLIIFITPYLIGDPAKTPGISETPQAIVPMRPGLPPEAPTFTPDGRLAGGEAATSRAIAWLEFQLQYFRQVNLEAMMTADSIRKLRDVIGVARALVADLQLTAGLPPYDPDTTAGGNALRAEELLAELNRALAYAQENLM
jgi:type II secretory pathway component GspD/PulD (secretin)